MKRVSHGLTAFLAILLTACASLQGTVTESIDNRPVEYALVRRGTEATVVFENGLGGTIDWWAKVFPEISKTHTAFAYNRPGYGNSAPVATPRDGAHVVDELGALLPGRH